ncbi:uncharacterized protein LOC132205187 [Neocloeon triangulifer]|uniref:uncharacterized protein LOC132205187 n=1 Tax=Neocloeon triangulifer TaxID=2078957 RepID=UPI00286F716F|nr:uncharacterized protein LOC132205187 [Neocloeon triangulifer]
MLLQCSCLITIALVTQLSAALLPLPTSSESKHPFRYDLMKDFHLKSTPRPFLSLDARSSRPMEKFLDLIRHRMQSRKRIGSLSLDPKISKLSTRMIEGDRTIRTQRAFDNMANFVQFIGDMDSMLTDRARLAVRRLSALLNEEDRFRRDHGH